VGKPLRGGAARCGGGGAGLAPTPRAPRTAAALCGVVLAIVLLSKAGWARVWWQLLRSWWQRRRRT
jgi:hypothetical protein